MERFCDKCGASVNGEGIFCPNCGAILEGAVNLNNPNTAPAETAQQNYGQPAQMNYGQSNMQNNQTQMPVYPQRYNNNAQQEPYENMSVGMWIGTMLLSCIPIAGLVLLFMWAFDSSTKQPKKNYSRAVLVWYLIGIALSIIVPISMGFCVACIGLSLGGYT